VGNEGAAIPNERVANRESAKIRERVIGKFLLRQELDTACHRKTRARLYLRPPPRSGEYCAQDSAVSCPDSNS
jgi:hypothetical protein